MNLFQFKLGQPGQRVEAIFTVPSTTTYLAYKAYKSLQAFDDALKSIGTTKPLIPILLRSMTFK